jgi:hypothetical protein
MEGSNIKDKGLRQKLDIASAASGDKSALSAQQ